jgi:4a-hydroxytetrahydrobiopterin dehydratase
MAALLAQQQCEPCNAKTPPVTGDEARRLHQEIPAWRLDKDRLVREWILKDFRAVLALANEIGRVAEEEQHHPDLHLTDYKHLRVELSTHAIHGLSRNDFVLAAKIDRLPGAAGGASGASAAKAFEGPASRKP